MHRLAKFILLALGLWPHALKAQVYDNDPLHVPIAMPSTGLPTSAQGLLTWLSSVEEPHSDGLLAIREQLYAIISADAKERFKKHGSPYPADRDSTLAELFAWADRLGLPGAILVASALDPHRATSRAGEGTGPGFSVGFDSLYTVVDEALGWMIRFPHYFMISTVARQPLENGIETGIVVLSTLFASDAEGASQATILVVAGEAPAPEFTAYWLSRLGLRPTDTYPVPVTSAVRSYRGIDVDTNMVKELVVFAPQGRTIIVAYVGLPGTAESNRPHFVNLLETLRIRP